MIAKRAAWTVWGAGVIEILKVAASLKRKFLQTSRILGHKMVFWSQSAVFLSPPFSRSPASFLCSPLLCSWTSLAAYRLIEMCKSFWHGMNRQLLAGCPMLLCVLPLNWSAPVCLPSSLLLPTLTVARFWHQRRGWRVPSKSLKLISTAAWLQRTILNRIRSG